MIELHLKAQGGDGIIRHRPFAKEKPQKKCVCRIGEDFEKQEIRTTAHGEGKQVYNHRNS